MSLENQIPDLVAKARSGDRSAFELLVGQHQDRLERLVSSRMGHHLCSDVEPADVVQEALLRAFGAIDRFRWSGEDSFMRWLGAIAENVILNATKRLSRRPSLRLDRSVAGSDTPPSKGLQRGERFERLESSLDQLSPDHREVILLARIEGLSMKEIACRMNRSESAVKNLLLRAIRSLRESFGDTDSMGLPDLQLGQDEGRDNA